MDIKKIVTSVFATLIIMMFFSVTVFAQQGTTGGGGPTGVTGNSQQVKSVIENPFKIKGDLYQVIYWVIESVVMPLAGIAAVLAFIWVGFLFVKAQGNDTELKKAKAALMNVIIGTAILFGAAVIAKIIETTIKQLKS